MRVATAGAAINVNVTAPDLVRDRKARGFLTCNPRHWNLTMLRGRAENPFTRPMHSSPRKDTRRPIHRERRTVSSSRSSRGI
jgi:hypothetical protein